MGEVRCRSVGGWGRTEASGSHSPHVGGGAKGQSTSCLCASRRSEQGPGPERCPKRGQGGERGEEKVALSTFDSFPTPPSRHTVASFFPPPFLGPPPPPPPSRRLCPLQSWTSPPPRGPGPWPTSWTRQGAPHHHHLCPRPRRPRPLLAPPPRRRCRDCHRPGHSCGSMRSEASQAGWVGRGTEWALCAGQKHQPSRTAVWLGVTKVKWLDGSVALSGWVVKELGLGVFT